MRLHKPTPGIVAGVLALVIAMGGSATAASLITSKQIKDGTIQVRDISKPAQAALKGQTGPMGPAGAQGPAGATGAQGLPGPVNLTRVFGPVVANPAGTQVMVWASCPTEAPNVLGGGVMGSGDLVDLQSVNSSGPYYAGANEPTDGWFAYLDNRGTANETAQVSAICTKAASVSKAGAAARLDKQGAPPR